MLKTVCLPGMVECEENSLPKQSRSKPTPRALRVHAPAAKTSMEGLSRAEGCFIKAQSKRFATVRDVDRVASANVLPT